MEPYGLGDAFTEIIRLGILHSPSGRFLTAEVFNNEINVSGSTLRRRQLWTLFSERGRPDTVYIQSHLGRFLSADKDGKVSGSARIPGVDERFLLEFSPETTGEWAFRSETHGFYLTGSDTQVSCFSKTPVWWAVRLAIHPQVHIRHQLRSMYLRSFSGNNEFRADMAHPWSSDTLIWIEQPPITNGKTTGRMAVARLGRVALRSQSGLYLKPDGSFTKHMDDSVLFAFELRAGCPRTFALRDCTSGTYLSTFGPGTVKCKPTAVSPGREELFLLERAALQVAVLAHNRKFASVKQGIEISANQHEVDETAVFKLEYVGGKGFQCAEALNPCSPLPQSPSGDNNSDVDHPLSTNGLLSGVYSLITGYWRLRSRNGKLWRMCASTGVQNTATDGDKESLFEVLALNDENESLQGQIVLRSNTADGGQSISARKLGAISSSGRVVNENELPATSDLFRFILLNRPSVVFLSTFTGGFVSRGKQTLLDCSSLVYEPFQLHITKNNTYQFFARDQHSTFSLWTMNTDGNVRLKPTNRDPDEVVEDGSLEPGTEFMLHFLDGRRAIVRAIGASASGSGMTLLKAELKGEVKVETTSELVANYIWEI